MKFSMDQMHLAQVRLARITRYSRTMLDGLAEMRITLNTQPSNESDMILLRFAKGVRRTITHRHHGSIHRLVLPSQKGRELPLSLACFRSYASLPLRYT